MPYRSKNGIIALVVCCGLMLWGGYAFFRQSGVPNIPQKAFPVPGSENTFALSTPWRNAQEALIYNGDQAYLVNVETGVRRPVPGFGTSYGSVHMGDIRFSPDGKWLLWATGTDQKPLWAATDLTTSRTITRPRLPPSPGGDYPSFAWFHDSRHWGELSATGTSAVIYSVEKPQTRRVTLVSSDEFAGLTGAPAFAPDTLPPSSPQMRATEHFWSPARDRIAWLTEEDDPSIDWSYYIDSLQRLHRIPHNPIPRHKCALWVSAGDGSHVQNVVPSFSCQAPPVCLRWTPDGKRLSFNYQRALWVAPAE